MSLFIAIIVAALAIFFLDVKIHTSPTNRNFVSAYDGNTIYCAGNHLYISQPIYKTIYNLTGPKILCMGLLDAKLHINKVTS
jgi:hypothetical protein